MRSRSQHIRGAEKIMTPPYVDRQQAPERMTQPHVIASSETPTIRSSSPVQTITDTMPSNFSNPESSNHLKAETGSASQELSASTLRSEVTQETASAHTLDSSSTLPASDLLQDHETARTHSKLTAQGREIRQLRDQLEKPYTPEDDTQLPPSPHHST